MARLRFGCSVAQHLDADWSTQAARAEELGYDVVVVGDHLGPELAPFPLLAAIAAVTQRIRLATYVVNADLRNPLQLAWDAASLDHLSEGRFELGVGAGHTPQEYAAVGVDQQPAHVRKARLVELVEIVRRLLDGETVDHQGQFFELRNAHVGGPRQERIPIMVGGNGEQLLRQAGRVADIVGLQGLGRTLADGHRHDVSWSAEHLDEQVAQIRRGADGRAGEVELSALVQIVQVTDDRSAALDAICRRVPGFPRSDAEIIPSALVGTVDQIVTTIEHACERWGIGYFVVRDREAFAPVLHALRRTV